jgi:hypothetical protein
MANDREVAETCITLPMREEVAADLLERGENSEHLNPMLQGDVWRVLRSLASLQGYEFESFCRADLAD